MLKELQDKSSTSPNPAMDADVFINLRACAEVYKWKKMRYPESPSSYHSNASRTNKFEDPCKELWRKH
jgi:endo-1,4-beta-D-glucanase Y